jgi:hypothetical protein
VLVTMAAVAVFAAAALVSVFAAAPAAAFTQWEHDGAVGCAACHSEGPPTNESCTNCHTDFESYPDMTCWSCHAPGQDTSTLSTPGTACSQECHLWDALQKQYVTPSTHGDVPHLGAVAGACLGCHSTSEDWDEPGDSPHHSGEATGFADCGACHGTEQMHAGKVACTRCHTSAAAFHTFTADSPGYKKCGSCHAMKHDGRRIAVSKCATCHKGTSGRAAQHSSRVTKKRVCSSCHKQKLHARSVSKRVKNCNTCHAKRFHVRQRAPRKSACTQCHRVALRHDNGYQCTLCHRRAVHAKRPSATN